MLKLKKVTKYLLSFILISGVLGATPSLALNFNDSFSKDGALSNFATKSGFTNQTLTVENYFGMILTAFFSILGVIAIILIIYSGFVWMTARGNEAQVTKAKENLWQVIIGLIFIIGGYALTTFLLKIFS